MSLKDFHILDPFVASNCRKEKNDEDDDVDANADAAEAMQFVRLNPFAEPAAHVFEAHRRLVNPVQRFIDDHQALVLPLKLFFRLLRDNLRLVQLVINPAHRLLGFVLHGEASTDHGSGRRCVKI